MAWKWMPQHLEHLQYLHQQVEECFFVSAKRICEAHCSCRTMCATNVLGQKYHGPFSMTVAQEQKLRTWRVQRPIPESATQFFSLYQGWRMFHFGTPLSLDSLPLTQIPTMTQNRVQCRVGLVIQLGGGPKPEIQKFQKAGNRMLCMQETFAAPLGPTDDVAGRRQAFNEACLQQTIEKCVSMDPFGHFQNCWAVSV